jgi:hypothetical protein
VRALLRQARDAHGLVIVDCGTDWATDGLLLTNATHVIWTLPATALGLARARALLDSDVLPAPGAWREVLVATAPSRSSSVTVRALRRLARSRCDRLVLIAHDRGLGEGESTVAESTVRALIGLAAALRSQP